MKCFQGNGSYRKAFTLIEIVTAVMVFSMVFQICWEAVAFIKQSLKRFETPIERNFVLTRFLMRIGREIRMANDVKITAKDQPAWETKIEIETLNEKRLVYWLEDDGCIYRRECCGNEEDSGDNDEIVANEIIHLAFKLTEARTNVVSIRVSSGTLREPTVLITAFHWRNP